MRQVVVGVVGLAALLGCSVQVQVEPGAGSVSLQRATPDAGAGPRCEDRELVGMLCARLEVLPIPGAP